MTRILVVEDDRDIADLIVHYIEKAGWQAHVATSGSEGLAQARHTLPDCLVLDVMLPGMDGLEVCRALAERIGHGRSADHHADRAWRGNGSHRRPRARRGRLPGEAVQPRRAGGAHPGAPAAHAPDRNVRSAHAFGDITMDLSRHTVVDHGREIRLTAKEFMLLQYFLQHRGRVLSRDLLLSDVWGYRYTGGTRTVDVHVRRLREKLPALVDRAGDREAVRVQARGRMNLRFRTKLLIASIAAAAVSLLVAAVLMSWQVRERQRASIESRITNDALLIAELLGSATVAGMDGLDAEADRLGRYSEARVTFIARDGRVLGDSTQSGAELARLESHSDRPEIVGARRDGRASSAAFQHDGRHRHALRRGAHRASRSRVREARPAIDGDQRAARTNPKGCHGGAGREHSSGACGCVGPVRCLVPSRPDNRRPGAQIRRRGSHPAVLRLRRRRARERRAHAR